MVLPAVTTLLPAFWLNTENIENLYVFPETLNMLRAPISFGGTSIIYLSCFANDARDRTRRKPWENQLLITHIP